MNGWQRLGIVVAGLISAPTFLVVHTDARNGYFTHHPSTSALALNGQAFANQVWSEAVAANPEIGACETETVRIRSPYFEGDSATITCDISHGAAFDESMWAIIVPFALIFGLGYAVAWIRAGFRQ